MAFTQLQFTKDWKNPTDFPTYEPNEAQVRADIQQLYDEIRDYINEVFLPELGLEFSDYLSLDGGTMAGDLSFPQQYGINLFTQSLVWKSGKITVLGPPVPGAVERPLSNIRLADPTSDEHAATKKYVDDAIDAVPLADYLPLSGGDMIGDIEMGTHGISFGGDIVKLEFDTEEDQLKVTTGGFLDRLMVGTPSGDNDATTKHYVDTNFLKLSGGTMTGDINMGGEELFLGDTVGMYESNESALTLDGDNHGPVLVKNVHTPTADNDAANKGYVDDTVEEALRDYTKTDDLADVATSGSYNDLEDKPTIPTVNNAILTIKQGGAIKGTFSANASADAVIDLDAGGGGGTGDHTQLSNRDAANQHPMSAITGLAAALSDMEDDIDNKANRSDLASVATSGDYDDLLNKPAIPSLTGYATEAYVDSAVAAAIGNVDSLIGSGVIT